MKKEEYNWWTDPKNKEEVEKISWWNHPKNKTIIELPVSIISDNGYSVIVGNEETYKLIGENTSQVAQGKTREEAIVRFYETIKIRGEFETDCRLNYQRWVPFRQGGSWRRHQAYWFAIFGIHVYFRGTEKKRRKFMKGGFFIPFTNLNISFSSDWKVYKRYKNGK